MTRPHFSTAWKASMLLVEINLPVHAHRIDRDYSRLPGLRWRHPLG
jgi:hypothetical protein